MSCLSKFVNCFTFSSCLVLSLIYYPNMKPIHKNDYRNNSLSSTDLIVAIDLGIYKTAVTWCFGKYACLEYLEIQPLNDELVTANNKIEDTSVLINNDYSVVAFG